MDTLTTANLLQELGLKSSRTLRHWRSLGLIGEPTIIQHPDGRGRIAQWPPDVVEQCIEVKKRLQEGKTLEEVADSLKSPRKRRSRFVDDWKRREQDMLLIRFRDAVTKAIRRFARENLGTAGCDLVAFEHLTTAKELAESSKSPVLVIHSDTASVIPRDGLGQWLSDNSFLEILAILPVNLEALTE
jgi:hypothetical protein